MFFAAFALVAASCDYQYQLGNSRGISDNALTRQAEPVVAVFKAGDADRAAGELTRFGGSKDEALSFVQLYGLTQIRSVTWTNVSYRNGNTARLVGKADLQSGRTLTLDLDYAKDGGAWAMHSINATAPAEEPAKDKLPDGPAAVAIARTTMDAVLESARRKTMAPLYETSSSVFKSYQSLAQYDANQGGLFELRVHGDPLVGHTPIFTTAPEFMANGMLALRGYYVIGTTRARFAFAYAFEGGEWRLASLLFKPEELPVVKAAVESGR